MTRPGDDRRGLVAAAVIGNLLEYFDFMSYGFFAVLIGRAFFPAETDFGRIMLSLVTYGVGFVTRPLGAAVFGRYADRVGRRAALGWSFGLMALGTVMLALIPPYAAIGAAAPALVVLARLIQGFASGGEMGPATVFLVENARAGRAAFLPSFQFGTQAVAMAMATGLGAALSASLSPQALGLWGWRVPFLLGVLVAPVGLYLRGRMADEPPAPRQGPSLGTAVAAAPRAALATFLINAGETVRVYIQGYMVTFAIVTLHLAPWKGMLATMLGALTTAVVSPLAGALVGDAARLRLVLCSQIGSLIAAYPLFVLVRDRPALWSLCALTMGFSLVTAPRSGAGLSLMVESLPVSTRAASFGVIYAVAVTIFGSSTQAMVTWITRASGNPLAPAWYLMGALAVSTIAYAWLLPGRRRAASTPLFAASAR